MANRRAATQGRVQIDPLLKPDWAAKQAAQTAQERHQQAVVLSTRSMRTGGGSMGDDTPLHVVMRQPSTMADKYALPSHLTKQLGQSSRRTLVALPSSGPRSNGSAQDGSLGGRTPQYEPSPLQRPERAYAAELSASISRSAAAQDVSGHDRFSAALHSNASRRGLAAAPPSAPASIIGNGLSRGTGGDGSDERNSLELEQLDGWGLLQETGEDFGPQTSNIRPVNGAWPGLNDEAIISRVVRGSASSAPSPQPAAAVLASRVTQPHPHPHPRVAALSPAPRPPLAPVRGSLDGSNRSAPAVPPTQRSQPRPSSNLVEQLVAGVDWSGTVLGDGERRASSVMSTARGSAGSVAPREQTSAPSSTEVDMLRIRQVTASTVPSGDGPPGRVGRAISSRDGIAHSASRLGALEMLAGTSNRWTGSKSLGVSSSGMAGAASGADQLQTSLPGSTEASSYASTPKFEELGENGLPRSDPFPPVPGRPPLVRFSSGQRARGASVGTDAAGEAAAEKDGSRGRGAAGGVRSNVTWSGMAGPAMTEGEQCGPRALGGGGADTVSLGSRAARAQALLARNKSNLSRLTGAGAAAVPP